MAQVSLTVRACDAWRVRFRWKRKSWQAVPDPPRRCRETWKPRRKAIPGGWRPALSNGAHLQQPLWLGATSFYRNNWASRTPRRCQTRDRPRPEAQPSHHWGRARSVGRSPGLLFPGSESTATECRLHQRREKEGFSRPPHHLILSVRWRWGSTRQRWNQQPATNTSICGLTQITDTISTGSVAQPGQSPQVENKSF